MSQMEYNQGNTELPKAELIKLLHRMESALGELLPCESRVLDLEEEGKKYQEEPEKFSEGQKKLTKTICIAVIITAVVTVLLKILSAAGSFLCTLLLFPCTSLLIIGLIAAIYLKRTTNAAIKKYKEERPKFLADLAEARRQLEECRKRCDPDVSLIQYFCPIECFKPRNLRKYISFFEDGRADTIKEARNLFDEWMHRERMEQKADAQYAATQEAIDAAYAAANAAYQAKASADQASYYSRFKQ